MRPAARQAMASGLQTRQAPAPMASGAGRRGRAVATASNARRAAISAVTIREPTHPAATPFAASVSVARAGSEPADEDVVRRLRAGETGLYVLLMRRYNQRLFRIARAVLADDAEAEDVVQEAWVRAFEHLGRFDGRSLFATWLTKIALYEALARRRRRCRLVPLDSERAGDERRTPPPARQLTEPSPEQRTSTGELRDALESAIHALPPALRVALVLRLVEGLSTSEAAATLDISEAALKVRLHRARLAMRHDLEQRIGATAGATWAFAGERCSRVAAAVLARLGVGAVAGAPSS